MKPARITGKFATIVVEYLFFNKKVSWAQVLADVLAQQVKLMGPKNLKVCLSGYLASIYSVKKVLTRREVQDYRYTREGGDPCQGSQRRRRSLPQRQNLTRNQIRSQLQIQVVSGRNKRWSHPVGIRPRQGRNQLGTHHQRNWRWRTEPDQWRRFRKRTKVKVRLTTLLSAGDGTRGPRRIHSRSKYQFGYRVADIASSGKP
jgi:hypothetical protein